MKAKDKKKEMAKKIKYEEGDDRHPRSIAAAKRERNNPRYPRFG